MTKEERDLYEKVLSKWGVLDQTFMLIEETSELLNAICKLRRDRVNIDDVVTEIADVKIMLEQMEVMFDVESNVEEEKQRKLNRLKARLEQKNYETVQS